MLFISRWASRNPIKSRFLLVFAHLTAVANALVLGVLLYAYDWPASALAVPALVSTFFVAYLLYPQRLQRLTRKKYRRQKACDLVMAFSCALLIAASVNSFLADDAGAKERALAEPVTTIVNATLTPALPAADAAPLTKAERRQIRRTQIKELKAEVRAWKKEHKNEKKGWEKTLLVLLVVGLFIMAGTTVAALSCSLACNGQSELAIMLLLGGLSALVYLAVIAIKRIYRKDKKNDAEVFA